MQVTLWRVIDLLDNTVIQEGVVIDNIYDYISVVDLQEVIYSGEIQHFGSIGYELQTKSVTLSW